MTDYKKGAILGAILGGLIFSLSFPIVAIFYIVPHSLLPFLVFLGMIIGCLSGLLFSILSDFFQSLWISAGGTFFIIWIFLFVLGSNRIFELGLPYTEPSLRLMVPWSILMFYFWRREGSEEIKSFNKLEELGNSFKYWLFPLVGFLISAIIFGLVFRQIFYQDWYYHGKIGTPLLLILSTAIGLVASVISSYLTYRKKEKQFNLKVLIYGAIIFTFSFSIFSGGMYKASIFTEYDSPFTRVACNKAVCDAGMNVINSTVTNDGSKIPTVGGGTLFFKRDGIIVREKNLSATDIGGGGIGDDHVWNKGETVSYDMDVSSSPYCSSGMTIESNQDYTLELKISERSRSTISTGCIGRYY